MLPAPSEMKMLHDWVSNPEPPFAPPIITLHAPVVIQAPALIPIPMFCVALVL